MIIPVQAKLAGQAEAVTRDFASDCFSPGSNSYPVNIPAGRVKRHHLAQGDWEGDYGKTGSVYADELEENQIRRSLRAIAMASSRLCVPSLP